MGQYSGRGDRDEIAALRGGSPDGAARIYDRFGYGMYAYACGFVAPSTASDVVHDAIWIATARIGSLRNPDLLRAWLFAIVRSECLRLLSESGAATDFLLVVAPSVELDPDATAVWEAAHRLDPRGREVADLAVRHNFDSHEIEALLGSAAGDGRVLAHAQDFVDRTVPDVPNAIGLFAVLPLVPLPHHLRDRLLAVPPVENELIDMGRRLDPLDRDGFPRPDRRPRRTLPIIAASIAVLAVLGAGAALVFPAAETSAPREARPAAELNLDLGSLLPTTTVPATSDTTTTTVPETTTVVPATSVEVTTDTESAVESATTTVEPTPSTAERTGGFTRRGGPGLESTDESTRSRDRQPSDTDAESGGGTGGAVRPTVILELPTLTPGRSN